MSLPDYYNMFHFLKKEAGYGILELDQLYPFEMEIYYWMAVKDLKDKIEALK